MTDPITRLNAALEGRYRIERQLGEGGMATVYLADDLRHERKVALKVLKPELAAVVGADRFLVEIKTTANLQHPHILPLFDSGEADSFLFYVMPYVEGESLRERLDREHQLPVDEAVQIAKNVAEALDYAHAQGVIHRDIKPANILLQAGKPVVSDFGIALAVGAAGGGRLTETGLSLGTPHYMSPEQATGDLSVGAATDIYALGCVLYEMLVGDPPYTGKTAQAVLGKIVTGEADPVTKHRRSVPANVDAAIRKALEKLPADRFAAAQDFAKALADPGFRYGEGSDGRGVTGIGRLGGRPVAAALVAGALLGGLAVGVLAGSGALPWGAREGDAFSDDVVRFAIELPEDLVLEPAGFQHNLAISPDGRMVASQSDVPSGDTRVNLTYLDRFGSTPIRGTDDGVAPVFSSDGDWIAFQRSESPSVLRRVPVQGGPAQTVTEAPGTIIGLSWDAGDRIVFGVEDLGLFQVAAAGGDPVRLTSLDETAGEQAHGFPDVIPGRDAIVFNVLGGDFGIDIAVLEEGTGEVRSLGVTGLGPRYLATGHIAYQTQDGIWAVPFDRSSLEVTGSPVSLVEDVQMKFGTASFAVSRNGDLVYARNSGPRGPEEQQLFWVDRDGGQERIPLPPDNYYHPRLSPDDRLLAVDAARNARDWDVDNPIHIWIWDFAAGNSTRLGEEGLFQQRPVWSADGRTLTYDGGDGVYRRPANNTGEPELLVEDTIAPTSVLGISPLFFTPDSRGLVLWENASPSGGDLVMVTLDTGGDPEEVWRLGDSYAAGDAELSPDGEWMAYVSDDSGRFEVYVRPFPDVGSDLIPVSNQGGRMPLWSRAENEIFYISEDDEMMSVSFDIGPDGAFQVTGREVILDWSAYRGVNNPLRSYDVSADGRRFVTIGGGGTSGANPTEFTVVLNWFTELCERTGDC